MCNIENNIKKNLQQVLSEIDETCANCERDRASVQLLAVSKTKPEQMIEAAYLNGQKLFGENYVQEGINKIKYFNENHPTWDIEWHFIGPLQSNKTRVVAESFAWVHSIERLKIAKRLNDQRPSTMDKLNVLIQVNTSHEESKSGVNLNELAELVDQVSLLPNLNLKGIMSIPEATDDYNEQLAAFEKLNSALKELQIDHPEMSILSMGMSGDIKAAIKANSNILRIGSAIFGERDYSNNK